MKNTTRLALFALVCTAATAPAVAETQTGMNASAAQAAKTVDQALNAQYKATTAKLSAPSRLLLRNAQRAWIGFRDQECKFEASGVAGGSAYPMVYSGCIRRLTDERVQQLRAKAQCQEGDLACPR